MKRIIHTLPLILTLLFLVSCSNEEPLTDVKDTLVAGPMFEVDLSQSEVDLTQDKRFKGLTVEQILPILEANSEPVAFPRNCSNCVEYVRNKDNRLMPVLVVCPSKTLYTRTDCFGGKRKLTNTCSPSVGACMVEDRGTFAGHVAYVEQVVWVHSNYPLIRVSEGNFPFGSCGERWLDGYSSSIKGYQNPNYPINCNLESLAVCEPPYGC